MSYSVKPGNIFGRIGQEAGKGLAESIPKEVERLRLAEGLKNLGQQKGLSPWDQFTGLLSVPGVLDRPQIQQTAGELLKNRAIQNAYKNRAGQGTESVSGNSGIPGPDQNIPVGQIPQENTGAKTTQGLKSPPEPQTITSDQSRKNEALSQPGAAEKNPLSPEFIPSGPWNQQRQDSAINDAFESGIATNFAEANTYANQQKELFEQTPEKYRAQLDYKKKIDKEVDDLFDKDMQTRLQKEGADTYKDLTGDLQLNLKKQARNAVATGKMNPTQAAEYYSKKALDLVKDKGRVLQIANRDVLDRIIPHKKDESLKSLMHIGKTFDDLGSSEDYYNLLTTDSVDDSGRQQGMGLSPGGGAIIAYPRSEKVKSLMRNSRIDYKKPDQSTRAFAQELSKVLTPKDSFLAIARQMKQQDPNFDEYAFFDYLRENQNQYGSNARLNREVNKGVSDFFPNWRDIGLFPAFTRSVAND